MGTPNLFGYPLILLTTLASTILAQENQPPELYKCSTDFQSTHVTIPLTLQPPMSNNSIEYWTGFYGEKLFQFQLNKVSFQCDSENITTINLTYKNNYTFPTRSLDHQYILNKYYFTPQGTLKIVGETGPARQWINWKRYCIAEVSNEHIQVQICPPSCDDLDLCISKCCAASQVLKIDYKSEIQSSCSEVQSAEWEPPIFKASRGLRSHFEKAEKPNPIHFSHLKIPCRPFEVISPSVNVRNSDRGMIRILESGKVMSRKSSNHPWKEISRDPYCIDRVHNVDISEHFEPLPQNIVIGLCAKPSEKSLTTSKVYFTTFIFSSLFALLTVIVYSALWDKQNIHGWTVVAVSFSMFSNLITSAIAHGAGLFQHMGLISSGSSFCILNGVIQHFFYTALFSWLTVLCFDLWCTISNMAPQSGRSKHYKRFLAYACFGFGVPTVVVLVSIIIELEYKDDENTVVYKPLYGQDFCSVDKTSFVYYTTVVNMILYGVNVIFAIMVGKTLHDFRQGTKRATSSCSKKSHNQSILYMKIFVITGITWIFEFISWFVAGENISWYWSIFDVFNILQPVCIFWIFVCKAEIRDQLYDKYPYLRRTFGKVKVGTETGKIPGKDSSSGIPGETNSTMASKEQQSL